MNRGIKQHLLNTTALELGKNVFEIVRVRVTVRAFVGIAVPSLVRDFTPDDDVAASGRLRRADGEDQATVERDLQQPETNIPIMEYFRFSVRGTYLSREDLLALKLVDVSAAKEILTAQPFKWAPFLVHG